MKQRSKVMTGSALGASVAAIWVGMLVTSSAIASEPPTDKVAVGVITASSTGDTFLCEFDDIAVVEMSAEEWAASLPGGADGEVLTGSGVIGGPIVAGEVPEGGMGSVTVTATAIPDGALLPADGFEATPLDQLPDLAGMIPGSGEQPRMGTAAECASVRPVSIPAFGGLEMDATPTGEITLP
jgi:hypothetical protein